MSDKQTRRTFMRTTGVAAGAAILPGFASATPEEESNIEAEVDTVVENGIKHAVSIARNPDTGEIDESIISISDPEADQTEDGNSLTEVSPEMYDISADVLSEVEPNIFDGQKQSANTDATAKSEDQDSKVWDELRKTADVDTAPDGPSIQAKSILQDVIEEIAAGTKDSIDRIGLYFEDSPKGTDCDAAANSKQHRQLGASIEYEKVLGNLTTTVLTSVLGTLAVAALSGSSLAPLGTVAGAVAGFAIDQLKDSTYITMAFRDLDACAIGVCAPSIRVLVSGVWMDRDTDMLTVNGTPDFPALHLENFAVMDVGYEEIQEISS